MTDPAPKPTSDSTAGETMRIAKFLAAAGLGPRRRCEELVAAGVVQINDCLTTTPATKVDPAVDRVVCRGEAVTLKRKQYLLLNKPPGYTCSAADAHAERLVSELLPETGERLFTVGRLDRESEGLLICTNDGDFAQRVSHPRHEVPKRYRVWVDGVVLAGKMRRLEHGIKDRETTLRALSVRKIRREKDRTTELEFVIAEGKNREIRRMCRNCGWRVRRLRRIQIGPVKLGNLGSGAWRPMSAEETSALLDFGT